ncbi:hypothetical protein HY250_04855 [Candidatus Azambacteria bacterium]|nr:hypothetical protein [Candidatus Azambacteria bacterium]MBI3685708.1 hypothetical protein [Candidatus Azambacteria bacterium]
MDTIEKALRKLNREEKERMKHILTQLAADTLHGLDIKKLKGRKDVFRVRKGKLRIIYRTAEKKIFVLAIERRSDTTYNL